MAEWLVLPTGFRGDCGSIPADVQNIYFEGIKNFEQYIASRLEFN